MPPLPKFRSTKVVAPVGTAPIPVSAADTGQGAIGQGLQQLGAGVGNVAEAIAAIEEEKQKLRDDTAISTADGDLDKFIGDNFDETKRTAFGSIEEIQNSRENFSSNYDAEVERSAGSMSERAGTAFRNAATRSKQSAVRQMEGIWWGKEIEFGQNNTKRVYTNRMELLAQTGFSVDEILNDPKILEVTETMNPYWKEGEIEKTKARTLSDVLKSVGRFDEATEFIAGNNDLTVEEKTSELNQIRVSKNIAVARAEEEQERLIKETTSQTISELYRNQLTLDELERRHDARLISDSTFEKTFEKLQTKTPSDTDPFAAREVRRAINDFQADVISGEQAEEILLNQYTKLNATARVKAFEDLEDVPEKVVNASKSSLYDSGRSLMSPQWADIESDQQFALLPDVVGLSKEEKKIINKRFTVEVNNRDQYEQAIDEMILRLRKDNRIRDIRREGTQILLEYQSKKEADLLQLEQETMKKFQATIPSVAQRRGETETQQPETLPDDVLQAELERVRARRREVEAR